MLNPPSTHNVAQVIVEEIAKWDLKDTTEARREKLYAMSDRLIMYFQFFDAMPATLPGLPGSPLHGQA
jgi:hypothetical protein